MSVHSIAFVGPLGGGNIGNDASLEMLLWWFQRHQNSIRLSAVTSNPLVTMKRYEIPSRSLTGAVGLSGGQRGNSFRRLGARMAEARRAACIWREADAFIVPGMGVFEDSIRVSPFGLPLQMALISITCRRARKPFMLIGIGAERARNPLTRHLFQLSARHAYEVFYRDIGSIRAMNHAPKAGRVMPDLVFAYPHEKLQPRPIRRSVTTFVLGVIRDGETICTPGASYFERLVAVGSKLARHGRVVLVGGDAADEQIRIRLADAIRESAASAHGHSVDIPMVHDYGELLSVMNGADVVIASRYHNLIAALTLGIPTICLSYAPKCFELMALFGLADFSWKLMDFDPDVISRAAREMALGETRCPEWESTTLRLRADVLDTLAGISEDLLGDVKGSTQHS